jgi:hypothetical protein
MQVARKAVTMRRSWFKGLGLGGASAAWLLASPPLAAQEIDRRAQPMTAAVETGALIPGYADVRIPGTNGTAFSLTDTLQANATPYLRLEASVTVAGRHILLLRAAPATFTSEGNASFPIVFAGKTFAAGTPLDARFTFDTYRASYRYAFVEKERLELAAGATVLIRDATIRVYGAGEEGVKKNVGVVPLLSARLAWSFAPPFGIVLDVDALAAPQGRAEDVLVALRLKLLDALRLHVGYRIIEGGADNDEVYNFNLLHFVAGGAEAAF